MPEVIASVGSFVIKELSGEGRRLQLVGRALPYRPFNLRTSQRVELSWYPGNPQATATVLGAKEEPTTIEGYWKDKFIGSEVTVSDVSGGTVQERQLYPITLNDVPVDSVRQAVTILDDIVRQGQLLEVTWDEQTRHGHLTEFDKRWDNSHDLAWSMTFQWISRGEPTVPAVFTTVTSLSDSVGTLDRLNADLQEEAKAQSTSIPTSINYQNELGRILSAINTAVGVAKSAVRNVTLRAGLPFDAARRICSICTELIGLVGDLEEFLLGVPAGGFNTLIPLEAQTFQERLSAAANTRTLINLARRLQLAAIDRRSVYLKEIEKDLLAIYQAREGDDLRDVSSLYYNTPFEWRQILLFNDLDSPLLRAGQIVLIPRLQQNVGRRRF